MSYPEKIHEQAAEIIARYPEGHSRSALLPHLDRETAEGLEHLFTSGDVRLMQLRQVGGAINDVPAHATAYAHRNQNFSLAVMTMRSSAEKLDAHWEDLAPYREGMYLSFDTRTGPEALSEAFPGSTLNRLRELKATYDPENVFDSNFPIPPAH